VNQSRFLQVREKAENVSQVCRVLSISRSGYYAAKRCASQSKVCALTPWVKAAFAQSGRSYGSRRVVQELAQNDVVIGRYKVRRLMRVSGLRAVWRRKFVATTNSRHDLPVAPNVLDRQFNPTAANRAWAADITYIRTRTGWLYLAVVIDLYSRKVVGWAMDRSMPATLVCKALQLAIAQRSPAPGLIVHSDRGSQYASAEHQTLLARYGLVCSMSRVANCWDNAVAERFFLSLKMERVWQRDYANQGEAGRDVADYIVSFYNSRRLNSTLGYKSPNAFEQQSA
jgi:putative transposase